MNDVEARELLKKHAAAWGDERYEPARWVVEALQEVAAKLPNPDNTVAFELKLYNDDQVKRKAAMLNRLELMFDDVRNELPQEYFKLVETLPFGSKVRITFEVVP